MKGHWSKKTYVSLNSLKSFAKIRQQKKARKAFFDAIDLRQVGDYEGALILLEKVAQQGDAFAQETLGNNYNYAVGVPQDKAKAAYWYEKAAQQGHVIAQSCLKNLL